MDQVISFYVEALCLLPTLFQDLPVGVELVLKFLAIGYVIPIGIALILLVFWFVGSSAAVRFGDQRAILRGIMAAIFSWGIVVLIGSLWRVPLEGIIQEAGIDRYTCWHGMPYPSVAAAMGFALGAALWGCDWRWGLALILLTGLWAIAQMCYGMRYPGDILIGVVVGVGMEWLFAALRPLNRFFDRIIRWLRRWALA